ncbi:MAG: thioredoxin domain-containing protein [Phycisphaerales bacterium]
MPTHRTLASLILTLTLLFAACGLAPAAAPNAPGSNPADNALSQVSDASHLVLYIPKISDANTKLAKYLKLVGVNDPQAADPAKFLLGEIGLSADGIDLDGSAAFVMPVLQFMGEPRFFLVLPIKDKAKLLAGFASAQPVPPSPNGQTYEGVLQVKTQQTGDTHYIKFVGNHLIISNSEAAVGKQTPATDAAAFLRDAGPLGAAALRSADVGLYLNMAKVGPLYQPMIAMFLGQMKLQMAQNVEAAQAMGGPDMAAAVFDLYNFIISSLFNQTRSVVLAANINDNDITARTAFQFTPDSTLAKTFAGTTTTSNALNQLPAAGNYLVAGSINQRALNFDPLLAAFQSEVIDKLPPDADSLRSMFNLYTTGLRLAQQVDDLSMVWFAPEKGKPESLMNMVALYNTKQPAKLHADYRNVIQQFTDILARMNAAPGAVPGMTIKLEPDALEVAGLKTDRVTLTLPQPDPQAQMGNPFARMLTEPLTYFITHTDQAVVAGMGQPSLLEQALKNTSGGGFIKNEKLAAVRSQLPADRFAEMYLDLGRYADFIAVMMTAAMRPGGDAQPNAVQTPDLPPLGYAASCDRTGGLLFTTVVPHQTVTGIHDYYTAQMAAMAAPAGTPVQVVPQKAGAGAPPEVFNVSDADFDAKVVNAPYPVLVVFTAGYSMDGKKQEKVFKDMLNQYSGDVGFARVDTGSDNLTAEKLKLDALPTTVLYAGGKLVARFPGIVSKEKLVEALSPHVK